MTRRVGMCSMDSTRGRVHSASRGQHGLLTLTEDSDLDQEFLRGYGVSDKGMNLCVYCAMAIGGGAGVK